MNNNANFPDKNQVSTNKKHSCAGGWTSSAVQNAPQLRGEKRPFVCSLPIKSKHLPLQSPLINPSGGGKTNQPAEAECPLPRAAAIYAASHSQARVAVIAIMSHKASSNNVTRRKAAVL